LESIQKEIEDAKTRTGFSINSDLKATGKRKDLKQ
jgi:hypothetical protein